MEDKRIADYFVVAGLAPDNPLPLEGYSHEATLKPDHRQVSTGRLASFLQVQ
jgi:hypothetical protein